MLAGPYSNKQDNELNRLGGEPNDLWAHPVVGVTPADQDGMHESVSLLWIGIREFCERTYGEGRDPHLVSIFGDDQSDRIVPKRSQAAFFTNITEVGGVDHLTVHHRAEVVEKVRGLLEEDPEAPNSRFQKGKF